MGEEDFKALNIKPGNFISLKCSFGRTSEGRVQEINHDGFSLKKDDCVIYWLYEEVKEVIQKQETIGGAV